MCMCGKPTLNGTPGYSWEGAAYGVRPVDPPPLKEGDELLYDEPGRCDAIDSHSYHLRLVRSRFATLMLRVRHGGGDEEINLGSEKRGLKDTVTTLDSNGRYWLLMTFYHVQSDAARKAALEANFSWRQAAAEKRIKTRKTRAGVKVWIEPIAAGRSL